MNFIRTLRKITTSINPVLANKLMYRKLMGKKLNLDNPKTFNEKINWLKIYKYPYDKYISDCVDKYKLHKILEKKGFGNYSVKLINSWDNVDEIEWDDLPEKFVLKCNHGSKYNIICSNKKEFNKDEAYKKLKRWMKEDYGLVSGELHYSNVNRKIICEEYLGDNIIDFQIWCTKGKVLFTVYINNPHGENQKITYDENWNKLNFVTSLPRINYEVKKPVKFDEMISIAKEMSKDLIFLRMDFYILKNGNIKISEMTFSPSSGFIFWNPESIDCELGKKIKLDNECIKNKKSYKKRGKTK